VFSNRILRARVKSVEAEATAIARFARPGESGWTVDEVVVAALATPIGRAFMLPEEWSFKTGPYFGQRGNLNTWLATEKIAFDIGGSTATRDVALRSSRRISDIYLDIRYSAGYVDLKSSTDLFIGDRAEIYAGIRDSTGTSIQYLAIKGHISGMIAPNVRSVRPFGFKPTIFTWMDVWESGPLVGMQSFSEWLLAQMFN